MRVFISWSQEHAKFVALALKKWLKRVIQQSEPFVSDVDIKTGDRWQEVIGDNLTDAGFGIICVTQENIERPWIQFEAGVLASRYQQRRVAPVLIGFPNLTIAGANPLSAFNAVRLEERDEMLKLARSINDALPRPLDVDILEPAFANAWDDLVANLANYEPKAAPPPVLAAATAEPIDEVLRLVRSMSSDMAQVTRMLTRRWTAEDRAALDYFRHPPRRFKDGVELIPSRTQVEDVADAVRRILQREPEEE